MKVRDLIKLLEAHEADMPVYYGGSEYSGDWREVRGASVEKNFGLVGLLLSREHDTPPSQTREAPHG